MDALHRLKKRVKEVRFSLLQFAADRESENLQSLIRKLGKASAFRLFLGGSEERVNYSGGGVTITGKVGYWKWGSWEGQEKPANNNVLSGKEGGNFNEKLR